MSVEPSRAGDQAEIHNLLARFAFLADEGDLADLGALFTADGVWEMGDITWRGRDEIVAGLSGLRAAGHAGPESGTRHIVTTVEVAFDGEEARARCYWLLTGRAEDASGRVVTFGQYHDVLRREDGAWRLIRRRVVT